MGAKNFYGILICVLVFFASFLLSKGASMYLNVVAFLVVVSGTIGSMFLSYSFERIKSAYLVSKNAYLVKLPSQDDLIKALLGLAVKSRYDGILSLEKALSKTTASFLRGGLDMLVDGFKGSEVKDMLSSESYFFKQRRAANERVFRSMARSAPAFGIIGSVIGLIGMLSDLGNTTVILQTIPIALTSTLYGILLSNYILTPIAENIHARTHEELLLQKMILNGILAISNEQNVYKLEKKLCLFLTPAVRRGHEQDFTNIRRRYVGMNFQEREEVFQAAHS